MVVTRRRLAVLAPPLLALLPCATASPAAAASDEALLRRHAPVLVLDAREPGPPIAVEPFLRGARGPRARAAAPPRVYGHAVRDGGRLCCSTGSSKRTTRRTAASRAAAATTVRGPIPTTRRAATACGCDRRSP